MWPIGTIGRHATSVVGEGRGGEGGGEEEGREEEEAEAEEAVDGVGEEIESLETWSMSLSRMAIAGEVSTVDMAGEVVESA